MLESINTFFHWFSEEETTKRKQANDAARGYERSSGIKGAVEDLLGFQIPSFYGILWFFVLIGIIAYTVKRLIDLLLTSKKK
jgi:hypothetical protein